MSDKVNLAICGYGGIGSHHAAVIIPTTSDHIKVTGIYDIKEERQLLAENDGYHVYDSYEDLINDDSINTVLIATPNHVHKDLSIQALNAGKNVICEKPVTLTSAELKEILTVEKETGKTFMVHQNRRWDDDYLTIKNLYDNKQIGDIFHIESRVMGANGIPGDWRSKAQYGGGMLYDWGVHLFDQILQMVDSPLKSVYSDQSFVLGNDSDDGFMSYLKFKNGVTAHIEVGTTNFIPLPRWYVKGLEGNAIIQDWNLNGQVIKNNSKVENEAPTPIKAGAGLTKTMAPVSEESVIEEDLPKPLVQEESFYNNFYNFTIGKSQAIVKNEEVLKVMNLIESMFDSFNKNEVIKF